MIDAIGLGLVAVFALRGFFRGFVRQAAFFAAIFLGIALANLGAERLAHELPDLTRHIDAGDRLFVAYLGIFLATLLAVALAARALESTLDLLQLRSVDRLLGFALGASCGVLLVAFLLACGLVFTPRVGPGEAIQRSLEESRSLRLVADGIVNLRVAMPHPFLVHAEEILEHRGRASTSASSADPEESDAVGAAGDRATPPSVERGEEGGEDEGQSQRGLRREPPTTPGSAAPRTKAPRAAEPGKLTPEAAARGAESGAAGGRAESGARPKDGRRRPARSGTNDG